MAGSALLACWGNFVDCYSKKTNSEKDKQIQELLDEINEFKKEKEKQQEAERVAEEQRKKIEFQNKQKKSRVIRTIVVFGVCIIVLATLIILGSTLGNNKLTISGWIFGIFSLLVSILSLFGINISTIKEWIWKNKK